MVNGSTVDIDLGFLDPELSLYEILFSMFEYGIEYSLYLKDIFNPKVIEQGNSHYLLYKGYGLFGYVLPLIKKGQECEFHFSKVCFRIAWQNFYKESVDMGECWDCQVTLVRSSKNKMIFKSIKFISSGVDLE